MTPEIFLGGKVVLHAGDSRAVLKTLAAHSIDSIVTDPPYNLQFMGKAWDNGETAFAASFWAECLRVLKPGGHVVAFSGTRTYHRMACAIEDAGFEIRDQLAWVFGSGFPKSHNITNKISESHKCQLSLNANPVAQRLRRFQVELPEGMIGFAVVSVATPRADGLDQAMVIGVEVDSSGPTDISLFVSTEHIGWSTILSLNSALDAVCERTNRGITLTELRAITDLKIFSLLQYQNTLASIVTLNHTALKPAQEPICLARKPLAENTIAANVLAHGTGAINVDGCRIESEQWSASGILTGGASVHDYGDGLNNAGRGGSHSLGRWPANLLHDGSAEVLAGFPETESGGGNKANRKPLARESQVMATEDTGEVWSSDIGSAARFFYTSKADSDDRLGSRHPTVKPVDLMQWLCRLVTPPGGTILDPFAGTGTTGEAAFREGFSAVLIEREAEYLNDIRRRMRLVMGGPDERARESIKARQGAALPDHGPLFAGAST